MILIYAILEIVLVLIHPLFGLVGVPVILTLHALLTLSTGDRGKSKARKREREFDVFDYWMDDQGL